MPKSKARVKKAIQRDIKRMPSAQEAKEVIGEIAEEVEARVESEPQIRIPGTIRGSNKTIYTYQDLEKMFPPETFIPEETLGLTYNGVRVQAIAGVEFCVPSCFKKLYEEHRKRLREKPTLADLGYMNLIELGAGALPPIEK